MFPSLCMLSRHIGRGVSAMERCRFLSSLRGATDRSRHEHTPSPLARVGTTLLEGSNLPFSGLSFGHNIPFAIFRDRVSDAVREHAGMDYKQSLLGPKRNGRLPLVPVEARACVA